MAPTLKPKDSGMNEALIASLTARLDNIEAEFKVHMRNKVNEIGLLRQDLRRAIAHVKERMAEEILAADDIDDGPVGVVSSLRSSARFCVHENFWPFLGVAVGQRHQAILVNWLNALAGLWRASVNDYIVCLLPVPTIALNREWSDRFYTSARGTVVHGDVIFSSYVTGLTRNGVTGKVYMAKNHDNTRVVLYCETL